MLNWINTNTLYYTMSKKEGKMPRKPKTLLKDTHPDIAAQLIDKSLLQTLGTGSDKSVEWECEHEHRWFAKVVSRTNAKNKTGCPVCAGKKVIPGINDLATLRPDIASTAVDVEACRHLSLYSNKKLKWKCEHGHVWEAPVYRRTKSGCGCPYCSGRLPIVGENDLATTHPDIASQLTDRTLAEKLKAGSMRKVEWVCDHGHIWSESPYARIHMGSGCPYCSNHRVIEGENDMFTTHPELAAQLVNPLGGGACRRNRTNVVDFATIPNSSGTSHGPNDKPPKRTSCIAYTTQERFVGSRMPIKSATNPF